MVEAEPIKEKKRIAAGINWRRIITAPMMIKIQREIPASFMLKLFPNDGVAKRIIQTTVDKVMRAFLVFDMCLFLLSL
jgi:hypothetical protein